MRVVPPPASAYLRAACRGCLEAVSGLHAAGWAHRSLCPPAFVVSSLGQGQGQALRVTLSSFGFAAGISAEAIAAAPFALRRELDALLLLDDDDNAASGSPAAARIAAKLVAADLAATGFALLEVILASLATGGHLAAPPSAGAAALRRLAGPGGPYAGRSRGGLEGLPGRGGVIGARGGVLVREKVVNVGEMDFVVCHG